MVQFPKRYLLLSSILCLFFVSCSISKYKHLKCENSNTPIAPVITSASALKYKASIDVVKNHLTGFIIIKQTDSNTKHIVFVTELGMKMFDFEAKENELKAIYVFEPLNKPLLVESLLRNFRNMFFINTENKVFNECSNKKLRRVVKDKQGKERSFYSISTMNDDDSHALFPRLQETYHGKKRSSKIEYAVDKQTIWYYSKIKCKQYGLIKFYFELNYIPPSYD